MLISHIYSDIKSVKASFPAKYRRSFGARLINLSQSYQDAYARYSDALCLLGFHFLRFYLVFWDISLQSPYEMISETISRLCYQYKVTSTCPVTKFGRRKMFGIWNRKVLQSILQVTIPLSKSRLYVTGSWVSCGNNADL